MFFAQSTPHYCVYPKYCNPAISCLMMVLTYFKRKNYAFYICTYNTNPGILLEKPVT